MAIQIKKAGSADAGAVRQNQNVTSPKKTGESTTKTSSTLSGNKNFQFGGVTNSVLASSLQKTGSATTTEAKTGDDKTSSAKDIEDSSVWQEATNKAGTVLSDLVTLNNTTTTTTTTTSTSTALTNAQSYYTDATNLLTAANTQAANGNWTSAQIILQEALAKIELAETESKKAGSTDSTLSTNISVQKQVIEAALKTAKANASNSSDSTSSGCSGCSGSGTTYVPVSTTGTTSTGTTLSNWNWGDIAKSLGSAIGSLFGTNKSSGNSGTSSGKKASGSGNTSDTGKAGDSGKTSELKYDKDSKGAKEIEKTAKPQYDDATKEINTANDTIKSEKANADAAEKAIDATQAKIDKIGGQRETLLQNYQDAKAKESEFDTNTAKQNAIVKEQSEISKSCDTQLQTKNESKTTVSGELNTAKSDLAQGNADLKTAEAMPKKNEDGTENTARISAIAKADAKIKEAKLKIQEKEAELKNIEADIKDLTSAKEKADEKVKSANAELKEIKTDREENDEKIKSYSEGLENADQESQKLKTEIDGNYQKLTDAESKIAQAEAQIDAAEAKQATAQDLADNIAERETSDGQLPWYDLEHGSSQEPF